MNQIAIPHLVADGYAVQVQAPRAMPAWFGEAEQALFGFLHAPAPSDCRSTAVLIVPPLGYEAICAHAALRALAERLAAAGFFVLRFDLPGTGDSAGDDHDPDRVPGWIAGIHRAIDALRAASGASQVALVTLRMSGLLALAAARDRADVASLVLWAPPESGRTYVRELRALGGFAQLPSSSNSDVEEIAGFAFLRQTLDDLASIDPQKLDAPAGARVLVVPRDDVEPLILDLGPWAIGAKIARWPGYAAAMRDPHEAKLPEELLEGIASWLSAAHPESAAPLAELTLSNRAEVVRNGRSGVRVTEEAVRFGPEERVFGILTHPVPPVPAACVVFVNAGAIHRVGMNRNYVRFARAWGERGVMSLRIDLSGLGDSGAKPGSAAQSMYSRGVVPDVRAALDFLERNHGVERFVLAGLCAGAYAAFHTALSDERVRGALMINPQTFDFRPGDSLSIERRRSFRAARWYRRALSRPQSWKKALRGEVDVFRVARLLAGRTATLVRSRLAALEARSKGPGSLAQAFEKLCERGTRLLLLYSADDPGLEHLREELGGDLERLREHPRFALELIHGADHTFSALFNQELLAERLARHLARWHGARGGSSSAGDGRRRWAAGRAVIGAARRGAKQTAATLLPRSWLIVHGPRRSRRIALTFDDGPTELTREYLDVLARYGVRASFFLIGRACERLPAGAELIANGGHVIGSHGFTHRTFPELGSKALLSELERTDALLPVTNNGRRWVRPPHGAVSPRSLFDCARAGFSTVLWSYDSGDSVTASSDELLDGFARRPPRSGDIVLLHEDHHHTLEALPTVLERLSADGYELVTVGELFD